MIPLLLMIAAVQGTRSDYERLETLHQRFRNRMSRTEIKPHWSPDSSRFWYRKELKDRSREFIAVDVRKGTRRPAFDHAAVTAALSRATSKKPAIDEIAFPAEGPSVWLRAAGTGWTWDPKKKTLTKAERPADRRPPEKPKRKAPPRPRPPEQQWTTFVRDHNLFLKAKKGGKEVGLTKDGTEKNPYSNRVSWSPDRTKFVALRIRQGADRRVSVVESAPKDQLQPKVQSFHYLKPGDDVPRRRPHLFDAENRREIPVSDDLFPNPWKLDRIRWETDGSRFTFLYNQRGHQVIRIVSVDAETGVARAIVNEECDTFFDYAHKLFVRNVEATNEIIWMSERDGWNHLYLVDARTGKVKNQITRGEWVVRRVDHVDEANREIWFQAGALRPGQDPYHVHYARIGFDGKGLVVLTEGDGTHSVEFSPDRSHVIDTYSRVDKAPVTEVRRTSDGALVCELERADLAPLKEAGWIPPERFVAKGRDGKTDIHGVIYKPTTFSPKKKYPVIEKIYAGPQGSHVPKSFKSLHSAQRLAELGFIVVQIDGMGTSNRSKAFHDVCWKDLGDAGFPDRVLWIKAAAKTRPYLDVSKVGIFGRSAGGQNAMRALITHGDFYKVAVAEAGCHDNRMDKIWWNELWMSWPVGPHYEKSSNVAQAHRLQGKLLLIVGELDRNVDPASTMQVVDALIKADKDFDLLVVPGGGHRIGGRYPVRRRRDFFVRHLHGVEPRSRP